MISFTCKHKLSVSSGHSLHTYIMRVVGNRVEAWTALSRCTRWLVIEWSLTCLKVGKDGIRPTGPRHAAQWNISRLVSRHVWEGF